MGMSLTWWRKTATPPEHVMRAQLRYKAVNLALYYGSEAAKDEMLSIYSQLNMSTSAMNEAIDQLREESQL